VAARAAALRGRRVTEPATEPHSPSSFDAVIVGAGHNGLTLAAYLARSGLSVGVFERRGEEGGGLCTEELTLPGFLHNVHANYHTFVGLAPAFRHLGILEQGVEYARPEVQMASVFDDGRALCVHTGIERTCASIARFSERDAETFARFKTEARQYVDLMLETFMYGPPVGINDLTKALVTFGLEGRSEFLEAKLRGSTIEQFLDRHFESDQVKAHLAFHGALCGYATDQKGLAVGYPLLVGKIDNWQVCLGGSHRVAHALWRDLVGHGGLVFVQSEVTRILTDGGRAVGVELVDGRTVEARRLVASSIDPEHTFGSLLAAEPAAEPIRARLGEVRHPPWSLFSVHLALAEAPRYEAASFDPDVDRAWVMNLGYSSLGDLLSDWSAVREGRLPDPRPNAAVNSLFDPFDAPPGRFTGLLRQIVPVAPGGGPAESWDAAKEDYARRCVEAWQAAAPNLGDAVLASAIDTPADISRKLVNMVNGDWMMGEISLDNLLDRRPLPELSGYRTPVERLYMCGSSQHPHGFITFAPGYNALQAIAADLDLEPWWRWE
jgi:phytoene dehydrogenase-like protein